VVIGECGIISILNQQLSEHEAQKIADSAKTLRQVIDGIKM